MFFAKTTVLAAIAGLLAGGNAASIEARSPSGLEVVKVEQNVNGTLTWYGAVGAAPSLSGRDAGCGTNTIKCSGTHAYNGPLCQELIDSLRRNLVLEQTTRAACLSQGPDQCCISWSKTPARTVRQLDLVPSAQRVFGLCGAGFGNSGQEWNVLLDGTCVSQCLSNRPIGCK